MINIKGLAGADGCVSGHVAAFRERKLDKEKYTVSDPQEEIENLEQARISYKLTLSELMEKGGEGAEIFKAYQIIVEDDIFFDEIKSAIISQSVCASWAIEEKRGETEKLFKGMDDEYLRQRADDISNVCNEITAELQGVEIGNPLDRVSGSDIIIFAEDLTPADTVRFDQNRIKGIVTERGGVTSHTVILAKALGIPAIVGTGAMLQNVDDGQVVLVYGGEGLAVVDPDTEACEIFRERKTQFDRQKILFEGCEGKPASTKDGFSVRVDVNSGDMESISKFDPNICDGVGLFRTEFLYMGQTDYPSEDFQFNVYQSMAKKALGKELIIRTLDIGGDKQLDYMDMNKESNPFLGYRAIRLCLDRTDVFKTQLRAILRASVFGYVKIMFPMIVNLEELLQAKELLREAMSELDERGEKYNKDIPVGIMIETPAAVLLSDVLSKHVSFFSIGSNDLIQYVTATDRMNEKIQYLYDSCNISVLRSIKMVCDNAHANGVEVGICGETASEPRLIPLWCAMEVDELSVAPSMVGRTKYIISQIFQSDVQSQMEEILSCGSIETAKELLDDILDEIEI